MGLSAGVLAALLMLSLSAANGCVYHHHPATRPSAHAHGHGPPPRAPAHGYRHTRHREGVDLVFDAGLGVYAVADWPGHYWHVDRYLRWAAGEWFVSRHIGGVWVVVSSDRLPGKLVAKHGKKAHRHKKRHPVPAKHDH
jgi:hypothetical protein